LVAQARRGQGVKPLTMAEALAGVEHTQPTQLTARVIQYFNPKAERVIRLHKTDILTFHLDGSITIDTGGFDTPTTRQNINRFLEEKRLHVSAARSGSYARNVLTVNGHTRIPFRRNMRFFKDERGVQVWLRDGMVHPFKG
jgi:hypothetical protein